MLNSGKVEDAVKLMQILTPTDRKSPGLVDMTAKGKGAPRTIEDQLRDRIISSDLPPDRQDELLKQAGLTAPASVGMQREFRDLTKNASLARQGNRALTDDEEDRLHDLRHVQAEKARIMKSDDSDREKQEQVDELERDYMSDHPARK